MQLILWVAFALAAIFEVGGDAVIRMGIRNNNIILMFLGAAALGGYGLVVNSIDWDFSKIFGVYVGVFALFGVLFGKFLFREQIQLTTWLGLAVIILVLERDHQASHFLSSFQSVGHPALHGGVDVYRRLARRSDIDGIPLRI